MLRLSQNQPSFVEGSAILLLSVWKLVRKFLWRKKDMKKNFVSVPVLSAVFLFLPAMLFGGSQGEKQEAKPSKLTIGMVVNTSDYKTAVESVKKWSADTGITVDIIEENTETYATSYVLASKTQNPRFDLIMFWDFYIDQLYSMLTPIDGSHDPEININAVNNGDILEMGFSAYKGHSYVIPYGLDSRVFFYRTDLLKEAGFNRPPKTWAELTEYAKKLTRDLDGDGNIDQWGFCTIGFPGQVFNTYSFFDFVLQNGGKIVDNNGRPLFNSREGVEALQFMIDLRNTHKVMPPDMITYSNSQIHEGFIAGRFAMVNHWPYLFGTTKGTPIDGKVGYSGVPTPSGGDPHTVLNAWGFGIPLMSQNKKTAWELAKYLLSSEAGAFEVSKMNDWPFRKSAYEEANSKYSIPGDFLEFSNFLFDVAQKHSEHVLLMKGSESALILSGYIDQAMVGKLSAKDALDAAVKEINTLLDQN
jgi:ABC-type glycerol-3-phosphate transport system substrate-binding protein